jgi:Protein of unknown function (DUF2752)
MQLTQRRLSPADLDYEFLWLGISLGSLGLAATWFAIGLPWPRCLFHDLTGLPCATCGMTRCAIQFFRGNFLAAIHWNPLVFAALCALSIFNIYATVVIVTRAPRLRVVLSAATERKYLRIIAVTVFALNWSYLLANWRAY